MKTKFKIGVLLIVAWLMLALISTIHAQNAVVSWSAFDMGFAVSTPSSSTTLKSAFGQVFVGTTLLGNSRVESGFLADTLMRETVVSVKEGTEIPVKFALYPNYPNPFNPSTRIRFALPAANDVTLKVFDLLGREVATLVNEKLQPGSFELSWDASAYASGVYIYRLHAGDFVATKKLMLLR